MSLLALAQFSNSFISKIHLQDSLSRSRILLQKETIFKEHSSKVRQSPNSQFVNFV